MGCRINNVKHHNSNRCTSVKVLSDGRYQFDDGTIVDEIFPADPTGGGEVIALAMFVVICTVLIRVAWWFVS